MKPPGRFHGSAGNAGAASGSSSARPPDPGQKRRNP